MGMHACRAPIYKMEKHILALLLNLIMRLVKDLVIYVINCPTGVTTE